VPYLLLPQLIDQEGDAFYRITYRWKPKGLIPDPYRRNLLKDAQAKFEKLTAAEDEIQTLTYADRYFKILRKMRLQLRKAHFAWNSDDLELLNQLGDFYSGYGIILRYLKLEQGRGRFEKQPQDQPAESQGV
jgi:hypothetical protein